MDSLYEAPRKAPVPTSLDKVLPVPVVPEVSMLASSLCHNEDKLFSYSGWKESRNQIPPQDYLSNKENYSGHYIKVLSNVSTSFKKQVRFESPVLQTNQRINISKLEDSLIDANPQPLSSHNRESNVPPSQFKPMLQNIDGKSFQQIYMSNIPNRHLDLSMIDNDGDTIFTKEAQSNITESPTGNNETIQLKGSDPIVQQPLYEKCTEKQDSIKHYPQTYRDFLALQDKLRVEKPTFSDTHDDSITDILNYRRDIKQVLATSQPLKLHSKNVNTHKGFNSQNTDIYHNYYSHTPYNQHKCTDTNPSSIGTVNIEDTVQKTKTTCNHIYSKPESDNCLIERYSPVPSKAVSQVQEEPTVKDLLKIIQQQNEQLLMLQKQVNNLIEKSESRKPIEDIPAENRMSYTEKYTTSTQHEANNLPDGKRTPRKGPLSKFSIDMMTSFEVSFRHHQNENFRRRIQKDFCNYEPNIQEITETESCDTYSANNYEKRPIDSSLHLQEPLEVREECPSPEPSIKIDMNDYDSSEDESSDDLRPSIYTNLMGQIGKLLKNAQIPTTNAFHQNNIERVDNDNEAKTMSNVKEATLRHLKSIGVKVPNLEETDLSVGSSDTKAYTPTEVSFAVKQLLMKYLPDDYLAKMRTERTDVPVVQTPATNDLIPPRPEFSFATVQYMKKYNLLATNKDLQVNNQNRQQQNIGHPVLTERSENPQKILDMSKLRQQPKLL